MRGWGGTAAIPVMFAALLLLLLLSTTCVNAWSFSGLVDSFNGRSSVGSVTTAGFVQGARDDAIRTRKDHNGTEVTDGKADASIIGAPSRRRFGRCKAGQRMDRRGKCRTVW